MDVGDPVVDYVAMWRALDMFHERGRMTEAGWNFLVEQLQRPLEQQLLGTLPATDAGALRALDLACHLVQALEREPDSAKRTWYRGLCHHLMTGARDVLTVRLDASRNDGAMGSQG